MVDSQSKYEFKQSGLSVSLGGGIVTAATNAAGDIRRSSQVEDERLKALYAYKAAEDIKKLGESKGNLKAGVSVSVSIGSSKMTSEQTSHTETVNSSNASAGGNVTVKATEGDVNLKGTKINATDVALDAKKNINIDGAENKQQTTSNTSSSSWAVGGSIGSGFFANGSKGSGKENEKITTNTGSVITASGALTITSGKDTNITGSEVKGDKVVANIGGNLNIASVQDTDNYTAKNQSSGFGITTGPKGGVTGSVGKGKTDSTYASVTEQAGIFAGKEGFDINVGKNTDLKGAVIASTATPDKNKISTGTLTYSDIQNKADYSASSAGIGYSSDKGFTPNPGMPVKGDADSKTHSAISPGTVIVGGVKVDPNISRNPETAVNALGKIFDKKTVQEKQELVKVFAQEANQIIHDISAREQQKAKIDKAKANYYIEQASKAAISGDYLKMSHLYDEAKKYDAEYSSIMKDWDEGGNMKVALHGLVGGLSASFGGGNVLSGATGAAANESMMGQMNKLNPTQQRFASLIIGGAVGKITGSTQTGATTAENGTLYNRQANYSGDLINGDIVMVYYGKGDPNNGRFYQVQWVPDKGKLDFVYYGDYVAQGTTFWSQYDKGFYTKLSGKDWFFLDNNKPNIEDAENKDGSLWNRTTMDGWGKAVDVNRPAPEPVRITIPETADNSNSQSNFDNIEPSTGKDTYSKPVETTDSINEKYKKEDPLSLTFAKGTLQSQGLDPDDPNNASKLADEVKKQMQMKKETMDGVIGSVGGGGFKKFKELKKFIGSPGEGNQWHHIVEQAQQNASRAGFVAEEINTVENIISLQSGKGSAHSAISGLYSSKPYWTGGLTVRDWLATKSFAEQFEYGMNVLKDYGKVTRDSAGRWIFTPFE